jgi:hypothetical protein
MANDVDGHVRPSPAQSKAQGTEAEGTAMIEAILFLAVWLFGGLALFVRLG